jgi:predicted PP-loop superfamily ATPase
MTDLTNTCIQMFSGGRDSTLAAIRLSQKKIKLVLVTVTTPNLIGIERVKQRLFELKSHLAIDTEWLQVALPNSISANRSSVTTCLPCHQAYLMTGVIIAENYKARQLALGYTDYQSTWTEQTPYAIESLRIILHSVGLNLNLPVIDITSKEQAIAELSANNLSEFSLEQKCIRQVNDASLPFDLLRQEVDRWGKELREALSNRQNIHLEILEKQIFNELSEQ